jgi:hypothetical protein
MAPFHPQVAAAVPGCDVGTVENGRQVRRQRPLTGILRRTDHARQPGMGRDPGHLSAHRGDAVIAVQGAKRLQQGPCLAPGSGRGRVQPGKAAGLAYSPGGELQSEAAQVCFEDLRRVVLESPGVLGPGPQPQRQARPQPAGTPGALFSAGPGYRYRGQARQTGARMKAGPPREAGIHHPTDTAGRDRRQQRPG